MPRRNPLERLRALCLALPEAIERPTWGTPTFRVRDKIFVIFTAGDGQPSISCKASPGGQEVLVGSQPERYYVPPYVGNRGWVGVRLGGAVDWSQVADLVEESYRLTAPKRLLALLDP